MTRKRFIKLCMAKGWQRNDAQLLAARVWPAGSYERLMHIFCFMRAIEESGTLIADQISSFSAEMAEIISG